MDDPRTNDQPTSERSGRGTWTALLLFLVLTPVLTWPMVQHLDQPHCDRGDYYSNIWNAFWVRTALSDGDASLYRTDYLHYPRGLSLARHTLSPVNSLPGAALAALTDPFTSINLIILLHFALAGFCMFLLARYLSGDVGGSILAGLLYGFSPFHLYYIAEVNVSSMGFLPLALLCFLRTFRDGGVRNMILTALACGLLAGSSSYYLVYAFLVACLVLLLGGLLQSGTPYLRGVRNLGLGGLLAGVVVVAVAWPLLGAALFGDPSGSSSAVGGHQATRVNDLLGFNWVGPPDRVRVSWPTMLGYSTLILLLVGVGGWFRQGFWIILALLFGLLSLGATLVVNGETTDLSLPYAALSELPVLSMLRKADRSFIVVLLAVSVLVAFAWKRSAARVQSPAGRRLCWVGCFVLMAVELSGVPFKSFAPNTSPLLAELGEDQTIRSVIELPAEPGRNREGRYLMSQVIHGKRFPQGYATNLALTTDHTRDARIVVQAQHALDEGNAAPLIAVLTERGIDAILLHKTEVTQRAPGGLHGETVWSPFFLHGQTLVGIRQMGGLVATPIPERQLRRRRSALVGELGEPILEDERIAVFRLATR